MKISKETAQAAMVGLVPADMTEYEAMANYVAKDGPPHTIGRAGCYLALGQRLKKDGVDLTQDVDLTPYQGCIDVEEAFAAFRTAGFSASAT